LNAGQRCGFSTNKGRWGYVVRLHVDPYDPQTDDQLHSRGNFRTVCRRWRTLRPEQLEAWRTAALDREIVTRFGRRVRPNCFHYFMSVNTQRADLGLPQFDLPPAEPFFNPCPVTELVVADTGDRFTLKLRVVGPAAEHTVLQGAAPVRTGVRCVQHFTFLGFLPAPIDGWSDITELYLARFGVPKAGTAIWIRIFQQIDGWNDEPKWSAPASPP
jgi:hypothetical protein